MRYYWGAVEAAGAYLIGRQQDEKFGSAPGKQLPIISFYKYLYK